MMCVAMCLFFFYFDQQEETNRRFPISSRRLTHESHSIEVLGTFDSVAAIQRSSPSTKSYACMSKWRTTTLFSHAYIRELIQPITNNNRHRHVNLNEIYYGVVFISFICSTFNVQCAVAQPNIHTHTHITKINSSFNCVLMSEYQIGFTLFNITTTVIGSWVLGRRYVLFHAICSVRRTAYIPRVY